MADTKRVKKQDIPGLILSDSGYGRNLIFCKSDKTFYLYKGGWYESLDKEYLTAIIRQFMMSNSQTCRMDLSSGLYKDVYEQLTLALIIKNDPTFDEYDYNYIAFKDKLFDFKRQDVVDIDDHNRIFTPFFLNFYWKDVKNDASLDSRDNPLNSIKKTAPNFCKFLETSIVMQDNIKVTDYRTIYVVQEILGYYLQGTKKKTVAWFFVGNGANGKTVLSTAIRNMFEKRFVSGNSLDEITNDSSRIAGLQGRRLNIAPDDESKKMKTDKFKALVSSDAIEARRLWEKSFTFFPTCKFLFLTNKMPRFESVDNGIRRRVCILPFFNEFSERQMDRDLEDKIKKEIPAIVGWAITGAKRLVSSNICFSDSDAIRNAKLEFEKKMSAVMGFIKENYTVIDTVDVEMMYDGAYLFNEFDKWCEDMRFKKFGRTKFYEQIDLNICKRFMFNKKVYFPLISNEIKKDDDELNIRF